MNGALAAQEVVEKHRMEEVEKVDDLDMAKDGSSAIDHEAEKRLVRKLDFWYCPS